ncbi:MAG: HlyD family secretion protein [Betaproteobacteria bacterium]|nr:HlyD family secretion protein [Betaproteobacteria bacterium]
MSEAINELNPAPEADGNDARSRKRKRLIGGIVGVFMLAGIAYGAYWMLAGRYVETTDNAYAGGNVVQITPQIAGTVIAVNADDTQFVNAGQVLVRLDQADAEVALEQAESNLAKTIRDVRNLYATNAQQQANVNVREADVSKAQQDVARRERLVTTGAVSREELDHARDALRSAQAALVAAKQQSAATGALVDRTTIEGHPDVQKAAATVKDAYLTRARTALPAPVSGFVSKRNVQLGQRVAPGTPLMAVVPLNQVWIDANFKEPQLANMRDGQPVTLKADIYGGKVEYHGRIVGFGAGTGAAFSLLPAQNATGNWIKIVQRVPVRIALDPEELAQHPLQIGLSMEATVDTHERGGERLPQVARATEYKTDVFGSLDELATARVREIIAANEGVAGVRASSNVAKAKPPRAAAVIQREMPPAVAQSAH